MKGLISAQRMDVSSYLGHATGEPLRVAVVGCGAVTHQFYAPALRELEQHHLVQVVALVDTDAHNLAAMQPIFPNATHLSILDRLADQATNLAVDLAIVASPPRYHAEQTIELLRSGIHVLCEKPMASSVAAARAMVACAESADRILAIGLVRRCFPAARTIQQLLAQNALGKVKRFVYHEGDPFSWPAQSAHFFQRKSAKGGVLLDIGVHVLDLLTWWWDQPVALRYADDAMGGVEANCHLQMHFAQGHHGEVRLSRDVSLMNRLEITCEQGSIVWNVKETDQVQVTFAGVETAIGGVVVPRAETPKNSLGELAGATFEQCFLQQLLDVIGAVQGKASAYVSGADGVRSLTLIDRCYQERTFMAMSWLGDDELRQARQLNQATPVW